jgi:dTDP-4-amino-4,6-dideoxy-D-galactose acyltransferase
MDPMIEEPCRSLEWDSQFFGRRIADVVGHRLSRERAARVLAWSAEHAIDCLYFLADSDDRATVRIAEESGFRLIDVRLTLARSLDDRAPGRGGTLVGVRLARPEDCLALKAIAATSYRDSRFYYDGHFSEALCDALYETWIENSFHDYAEAVLVLDVEDRLTGYVSCHLPGGGGGKIGLLGVAADRRGEGAGHRLVEASLAWFAERDCQEVTVVTQGRNCRAQRLYQRVGFVARATQLWYHRWFPARERTP